MDRAHIVAMVGWGKRFFSALTSVYPQGLASVTKLLRKPQLLLALLLLPTTGLAQSLQPHYLVLHSYSPSYQWTSDIQDGITQAARSVSNTPLLSIEYLNTKRIFNEPYLALFREYLSTKYQGYDFDGVILSDDHALNFFQTLDKHQFGNIPTVAIGINSPSSSLSSMTSNSLVVPELLEVVDTIASIHQIQTSIRNLYLVSDNSYTSEQIRPRVIDALQRFPATTLIEIRDKPLVEVAELLKGVDEQDAVLLVLYNPDLNQDVYYTFKDLSFTLGPISNAPIFVFWEGYLGSGVFGGHITRSFDLGQFAVRALNSFSSDGFNRENANVKSQFIVDYKAVKYFDTDSSLLPVSTVYINKPTFYIVQHWRISLFIFLLVLVFVVVTSTQFISIRRKHRINKQNVEIMELQDKTLAAQKGFINVLGEAIESRSGATSDHVKRVAELSGYLGELSDLSFSDCELLKTISPMHDVGKIAITEEILEKPGKLNDAEREVMKMHCIIGHDLLISGEGEIMRFASIIALEHHERWDGKGYPKGLIEDEAHVFSRITAVADVFDALLSARCYKEPWPLEKVIKFFEQEKGKQFDPVLTDLLLGNIAQLVHIRSMYPDR